MKLKLFVTIPPEVDKIMEGIKRSDARSNFLQIYNAFYYLYTTKPEFIPKMGNVSYFDVPSSYLKSINKRYHKYLKILKDNNIITYYSNNYIVLEYSLTGDDKIYRKKYYNTKSGECIKYRFLINPNIGREIEVEIPNPYEDKRWYKIIRQSLNEVDLDHYIKRDSYSRRLHHRCTFKTGYKLIQYESDREDIDLNSYKKFFSTMYPGEYAIIDAQHCQPTLLYHFLKEEGIVDDNFNFSFENNIDFYDYMVQLGISKDRNMAKRDFVVWLNGDRTKCKKGIKEKFSELHKYFYQYKTIYGQKSIGRKITRMESSIFIDDLLENFPFDFCITIHDSLIVRVEDIDKVMDYCNGKYGRIVNFRSEVIKNKYEIL